MRLSKEQISNYFNNALNNELIKNLVSHMDNDYDVENGIKSLFSFLSVYITSTSDLDGDIMNDIINDFAQNFDDYNRSLKDNPEKLDTIKREYFTKHIFPIIFKLYTGKEYSNKISLSDIIDVGNKMATNSSNNLFLTHSFPGALEDKVSKEGLNIHNELFPLELKYLNNFGFKSSFKTGVLCLTQLSDMSVAYAMRCPERIRLSFGSLCPEIKKKENESIYEYHCRVIETFENKNIGISGISQAIEYLKKINDFYFINDKCCIAVIDNNKKDQYNEKQVKISYLTIARSMKNLLKKLCLSDSKLSEYIDKTEQLLKDNNPNGLELLDYIRQYLSIKYPDNIEYLEFSHVIEDILMNNITQSLNNFYQAYGDGFKVDSGIVEAEKISIVSFTNPQKLLVDSKKNTGFGSL